MNKTDIQLKEAIKSEVRKVLKEELLDIDGYKYHSNIVEKWSDLSDIEQDLTTFLNHMSAVSGDDLVNDVKDIFKKLSNINPTINEMARVAKTLKIADKEAAQQVIEKFQGTKKTWIADMITKVIESGDEGVQQVALAKAVGKVDEFGDGRQQAINPEVRSLLNAGVFTYGEAGVKTEPKSEEPIVEPKPTKKAEPKAEPIEDTNDEEDVEVEDEYEKIDTEDQGEDEEELAKKAAPSKKIQSKASELDKVIKDMKKMAAEYKKAKDSGDKKKEKELADQLKEKTKLKKQLEKEVKIDLGDEEDEEI